jgi:stage V sporulation protein AD
MWILGFVPQLVLSITLAAWFSNHRLGLKGLRFFKTVIYFPNLIIAASFASLFFSFFADSGPVNSFLTNSGILNEPFQFFSNTWSVRGLVAFMNCIMWFGNTTLLLLAGMLTDGGFSGKSAAVTSSHFSTAERQFRFPLSYGGQRTPTAQWTCTASGAVVVSTEGDAPFLVGGCIGKIADLGVTDTSNMGAAMAPAAADTIMRYLQDTKTNPEDYDAIITGDLGNIGSPLLLDLLLKQGINIRNQHQDCGSLMFDEQKQDTHAGGSGCGCSASILCGYFLPKLKNNEYKKILFAATGALLSAMSPQQGESIPAICHLVEIRSQEGLAC